MIEILYVTRAKLSLRRAHVHNILRTADALSRDGFRVIVATSREIINEEDIRRAHGVRDNFVMMHTTSLVRTLIKQRGKSRICYVRDPSLWYIALFARVLGYSVFAEIHGSVESLLKRVTFRLLHWTADGCVYISEGLREWYGPSKKPNAVISCIGLRDDELNATEATDYRAKFGITAEQCIALYAGGASGKYYNMTLLVNALLLTDKCVVLVIMGMKQEEQEILKALASKIHVRDRIFFGGRFEPIETMSLARGADILVSPKSWATRGAVSAKYYAYLAAGKPLVVCDNAVDREILNQDVADLIEPSAEAFAKSLADLAHNVERRKKMGESAFVRAHDFTEQKRTASIRSIFDKIIS